MCNLKTISGVKPKVSLLALSDLHLSFGIDKPMDVFGLTWHNYMDRISQNWQSTVADDDLVIIGGDLSWATYLDEAKADFEFLNNLPGKKLLIKGNHDYWWESITKLKAFVSENGFDTISFLHNSACMYEDFVISGTRGWILPGSDRFGLDDKKIYERELIRLSLSLDEASKLQKDQKLNKIVVLHYPPILPSGKADERILSILLEHDVKKCIYGHLHGSSAKPIQNILIEGIEFMLTSADYLGFKPLCI